MLLIKNIGASAFSSTIKREKDGRLFVYRLATKDNIWRQAVEE
ncbi:hypothetical protein [Acinetobacter lwoffii]|nr:hypothetical protein [Acinetobacter lwoffii]